VVALTYRATVDVPARFRKSKAVGAVFGLTCSKYQSGEIDRSGRISRCGDEMMRVMLYEAAQVGCDHAPHLDWRYWVPLDPRTSMLRSKKWSWLKAWAYVRLDLSPVCRQGRLKDCSTSSSNPMMEGPGADSEEKHEPASDINTVVVDSLKRLTRNGRLEKRTSSASQGWGAAAITPR
jgi:Transposase IS116/IS110/IS902 family